MGYESLEYEEMGQSESQEIMKELEKLFMYSWAAQKTSMIREVLLSADYRSNSHVLELFSDIRSICKKKDERFFTALPIGTCLYRARVVRDIGDVQICSRGVAIGEFTKGFDEMNSREAPFGKSSAGRNNLAGVPYLYLASDPATACAELKHLSRSTFSVAEFELARELYVVDLVKIKSFSDQELKDKGFAPGKYWGEIMFWFSVPVNTKDDYIVTQIISNEFRKQGVDGLLYGSFFGIGDNFTIFDSSSNDVVFKNSRLVQQMYTNQVYWDYNNKCCLESYPDHDFYQFSKEDASEQLRRIKKSWGLSREKIKDSKSDLGDK